MTNFNEICEVEVIYKRPVISSMEKISCSADTSELFRELVNEQRIDYKEFFFVAFLNRANYVLGVSIISSGATNGTLVNIKEILQLALKTNSSNVILGHNHPSGNAKPSQSDINITKRIKEASKLFDITLLDHIILTSESYFSFADDGLI